MDARADLGRVTKTLHHRLKSNAEIPFLSVVILLIALRGLQKITDGTAFSIRDL